ncbi:MAG: ligase-associated DNA damage response endonuclease PdeM [Pseudomonadota bacterium]
MNEAVIELAGARLVPLASGGLYWPDERLLCVSDLHLGKSDRIARRGGTMLPPYETRDTLARIEADLSATGAKTVVCLGDSFDDRAAAESLEDSEVEWILRLQAGRRWVWIEGNHDPGPVNLAGTYLAEMPVGPLVFRHIAQADAQGEVSGHYHPKAELSARGRRVVRRCFLWDGDRIVMPAYGTYTGGLSWTSPVLQGLMSKGAQAALLGSPVRCVPVPGVSA